VKSDKCSQGTLKLGEDYGKGRFARDDTQIFTSVEEKAMIRLHVIVKNCNARATARANDPIKYFLWYGVCGGVGFEPNQP